MNVLIYSIVAGSVYGDIADKLHPDGVVRVNSTMDRLENRASRANLVPDWKGYDVIVCLEADVSIPSDLKFSNELIEIEKGTSDIHTRIINEPFPYHGVGLVSIPVHLASDFFDAWKCAYSQFGSNHNCDERVLREALDGFPWRFREDNTFWPDESGSIIHYQGVQAKRSLIPDFTQRLMKDYNT